MINIVQMCEIMNAPFRAQSYNYIASFTQRSPIKDQHIGRSDNRGSLLRKDINTLVHARSTPWLVPECVFVPISTGSTRHRDDFRFWDNKSEAKN